MKTLMKIAVVLSLLGTCQFGWGTLSRIDPSNLAKIQNGLIKLADSTWNSGNPKPNLEQLKERDSKIAAKSTIFIAKMDSFGLDRYYSFETQDDIDQLVEAVENGGGRDVSWYYVPENSSQTTTATSASTTSVSTGTVQSITTQSIETISASSSSSSSSTVSSIPTELTSMQKMMYRDLIASKGQRSFHGYAPLCYEHWSYSNGLHEYDYQNGSIEYQYRDWPRYTESNSPKAVSSSSAASSSTTSVSNETTQSTTTQPTETASASSPASSSSSSAWTSEDEEIYGPQITPTLTKEAQALFSSTVPAVAALAMTALTMQTKSAH